MDKNFHKVFDKCPNCGSSLQFLKELGDEVKAKGQARQNWNMRLDVKQGLVFDPVKQLTVLIGAKLPGYAIMTDICMECGTIYAVELRRIEDTVKVLPKSDVRHN